MASSLILGAAAALIAAPLLHQVNWQNTQWGMTVDQVRRVCGAPCAETPASDLRGKSNESQIADLTRPWTSGDLRFQAYFMFDRSTRRLGAVRLEFVGGADANSVEGALRTRYGQPANVQITQVTRFLIWYAGQDQVGLLTIGGREATIWYQPRVNRNNQGL
jgi:hypothetical protein